MNPPMTKHARVRAAEMGVTDEEIEAAYYEPDRDYPQRKYLGQRIRTRGRIALAYNPYTGKVITVLWDMPKGTRFER